MSNSNALDLAQIFQQVGQMLQQNREALNQADPYNANHGDHMTAVFEAARQAAEEKRTSGLVTIMEYAARLLESQAGNGSAQAYAHGLSQLAEQFQRYNVSEADLIAYVQKALADEKESAPFSPTSARAADHSGDVLKALVNGLSAWAQAEARRESSATQSGSISSDQANRGGSPGEFKLNMGSLFEFGMAYLQAKQRGGERVDVLADTAASVSPLSQIPHRYESAKLAIAAFLRAIQQAS